MFLKNMLLMNNYFIELVRSGSLFWFCALAGSGMFLIQFIINLFGMGNQDSFDSGEMGQEAADVRAFKWLSMQTITGFLMVFGWAAVTCQYQFGFSGPVTVIVALCSGIIAALIVRSLFKLAGKLRSSGTVYQIEDAIGKEAYVYQNIPKGGKGKVSLSIKNFTHEIDAISKHYEDLPSFMRVKIIEKSDDNTVIVAPLV